jgi:hypothetical protein
MKRLLYIITFFLAFAACTPQMQEIAFCEGQEIILTASIPNAYIVGGVMRNLLIHNELQG